MREVSRVNPIELEKANLRILRRDRLLPLLTGSQSQTKMKYERDEFFCERFLAKSNFRLSVPVADLKSQPSLESTFVIILYEDEKPQTVIVIPPSPKLPFEVAVQALEQKHLDHHNRSYFPTNPEVINQIIAEQTLETKPVPSKVIRNLLNYFVG